MDATRRVTAVLGPTNTGKTHYAIERMLAHRTGVIGLPLRLLAREVYDRIVAARAARQAIALAVTLSDWSRRLLSPGDDAAADAEQAGDKAGRNAGCCHGQNPWQILCNQLHFVP